MIPLIFSYKNIHKQYLACRKMKFNSVNALRFELNAEEKLTELQRELVEQTYGPSRSVCFVVDKPKLREIFAADFRDRIVHHILVSELEKIWEPIFIFDTYACRRGKGNHLAVQRLQKFTRSLTTNGTRQAYFLQLDIRNFFAAIHKETLYKIISDKCRDENILWLARLIIST